MDILNIIVVLLILIVVTFIIARSWVFICDCLIAGLKKLFHIGKKENKNWHIRDDGDESTTK